MKELFYPGGEKLPCAIMFIFDDKKSNKIKYSVLIRFIIFFLLSVNALADAKDRQILMILGYDGDAWHPYMATIDKTIKRKDWRKLNAIENPVLVTRQPNTGTLFVKKDNGELVQFFQQEKRTYKAVTFPILASDTKNYTHLRAYNEGVLAVSLMEGKSRETDIVDIRSQTDKPTFILKQTSAQFHPLKTMHSLFYAHVSCRLACDPVIQEVWRRDLISGKTQQLTLLNATSYLHSVDSHERYGFISSNQSGYYHVGRLDLTKKKVIWLTQGQVTDSYPSMTHHGDVYFIRRDQQGTHLMRLVQAMSMDKPQLEKVTLPKLIKKIRYLEISDQ